jgi:hypothetical protein
MQITPLFIIVARRRFDRRPAYRHRIAGIVEREILSGIGSVRA